MTRWLALVSVLLLVPAAHAQGYPGKPIRLIVGFPPGGGTDVMARILGPKLAETLGQAIVIENRPGAASTIAADLTAKAPPDGYTLTLGHVNAHAIAPGIFPKLPYDAERDLAPVAQIAISPNLLVVHPAFAVKTVADIVARARAQPGRVICGSAGSGSTQHLSLELLKSMAKVDILHVPYKGSGPLIADLIGGQVMMSFDSSAAIAPHIKSGRVLPIAITGAKRSAAFPDLPTVAESGFPGYEVYTWWGLFGPAGMPRPVVERLHTALTGALRAPDVVAKLGELGADPVGSTPEQFAAFVKSEIAKWGRVVRESGAKID